MRTSFYTPELIETIERWDGQLLGPGPENRKLEGIQVFRPVWFEAVFGKAHPIMPGVWWGPVIAACAYFTMIDPRFAAPVALGRFIGGVLAWTLLEYVLHRWLFHKDPGPTFEGKFRQFMIHGYHHEFPNDRMRLVAPLLLSGTFGLAIGIAYYALAGSYDWLMWYAGTAVGYIAYDWMHYYTHHFRPTTRLGKFLRRYHMEHHYKDSESHFGISSPLWDFVFGTWKAKDTAPAAARSAAS